MKCCRMGFNLSFENRSNLKLLRFRSHVAVVSTGLTIHVDALRTQ
jgi:hypothetical protein